MLIEIIPPGQEEQDTEKPERTKARNNPLFIRYLPGQIEPLRIYYAESTKC